MIQSFRLKNLRCFEDTDWVDLEPLTILLGRNSSGKSTFARTFPLIKQSIQKRTRGPVLWYGEGDYVDFGTFEKAIFDNATDSFIEFSFDIDFRLRGFMPFKIGASSRYRFRRNRNSLNAKASIRLRSDQKNTYTSSVFVDILGERISINFSKDGRLLDVEVGDFFWQPSSELIIFTKDNTFFPSLVAFEKEDASTLLPEDIEEVFSFSLLEQIGVFTHGKTSEEKIESMADSLSLTSKENIVKQICDSDIFTYSFQQNILTAFKEDKTTFNYFFQSLVFSRIPLIFDSISRDIFEFFGATKYIRPVRATAKRFYRRQELAVDEIDASGENVHMFLDSLSEAEQRNLNSWLEKNLGFSVKAKSSEGHVEIVASEGEGTAYRNISDMGFGYSQLLPVALQIWDSLSGRRRRFSGTRCIVIEQPELHLHPGYQRDFAKLISSIVSKSKVKIILETHSQYIVNQIGEEIAKGFADNNDFSILLFEKNKNGKSHISRSHFNEDGILVDWPFGFFDS